MAAGRLQRGPSSRAASKLRRRPVVVISLLVTCLATLLGACLFRGSDLKGGERALIDAFSKRRMIEARLSGGFRAGEFNPSRDDASGINATELARAQDRIQEAAAKQEPNGQLAYARLLLSKGEDPKGAVKYLRLALAGSPDSAEAHNDLGVCLFQQDKFEDAIDEFEAALKQNPDMTEALFNRALCYERLLLRQAAATEYGRLLTIEREPSWITEIRHRQDVVSTPLDPKKEADTIAEFVAAVSGGNNDEAKRIAYESFEVLSRHAVSDLTVEYLDQAVAGNRQEAQRALSMMETIGKFRLESTGDRSTADLSEYLQQLASKELPVERGLIREYLESEKVVASKNYSDAQDRFERLTRQFANRGNFVFQMKSILYTSSCLYGAGRFSSSINKLKEALLEAENHDSRYLRASILCQLGGAYSRLGQDSLAIRYCEEALKHCSAKLLEAKVLQYIGNACWHLGDFGKGLSCLYKSTGLSLSTVPTPSELANNYLQLADIYRLRGNHSLALLNARQAVAFLNQARQIDNNRAAQVSSFIAVEQARLGESEHAETELRQALQYVEKTEHGQRKYTEPLVLTRAGEVAALQGAFDRAISYYEKAQTLVEKSEERTIPLIRVLRGRSEVYGQAKAFDKARLDLERAVDEIEGYRSAIAGSPDRRSFLDASQSVFDQLISLNINVFGRQAEAFNFSEESRARTLLDEFASGKNAGPVQGAAQSRKNGSHMSQLDKMSKPLPLDAVKAALPDDLRLLAYSVTAQRTYIFLVTRSGLEMAESPATTETLDRLVSDYVSDLKSKAPIDGLLARGRELYRLLIEPVEKRISDGKLLCIAPDKALHFLPFAPLVDGSDRYFIESHRLTYAPSATALVHCLLESSAKGKSAAERIFAVGNPRFNREQFPTLEPLFDAEREAHDSADLYQEQNVLTGSQATEREVQAGLKDCDVAHFAVHCLVEERSPWLAALVLAGKAPAGGASGLGPGTESSPDDGLLYLNEIYKMSLPRTRLVVLSACQSGLGQYYRGEGIVSLARPFLALSVPTVVVSLWSIDSLATGELMIEFHRRRKVSNQGASDALRDAQIYTASRAEYAHPYYWAPFIAVGSNN